MPLAYGLLPGKMDCIPLKSRMVLQIKKQSLKGLSKILSSL